MMACTSPACTARVRPLRISLPPTLTCRLSMLSIAAMSAHRPFETDRKQRLRLDRELHRPLLEPRFAKTTHDHVDGILRGDAARQKIEQLVIADLGGARLVLDRGGGVLDLNVREGVRAAARSHQQRIALGEIARTLCARQDLYQAAVGVLACPRRDALGDDRAARVLADVDHLGAG